MTQVSIHVAKAQLSALVQSLEEGEDRIVISRYGKPVAEIVPCRRQAKRSVVDPELAALRMHADMTEPTEGEWEHV